MLNFGHTIAHAIETVAGYDGRFLHGEAVSVGMVAESRLAGRMGWIAAGAGRSPGRLARAVRPAGRGAWARSPASQSAR